MIFVLQKGYNYYLLIIDMSLASDLSAHHDHSSLCHSLARNLRNKKIKWIMRLQITGSKKMPFTFASGSCLRWASRIASDTWSHILSVNIQYQAKGYYLCLNWGSDLVVFLQLLKCCIVKITFPINFVNHGLMRKSAAQYLCLQIANLPLTVNIYCCCITVCG